MRDEQRFSNKYVLETFSLNSHFTNHFEINFSNLLKTQLNYIL